jgi:DNA polymerase III delta prime subunit
MTNINKLDKYNLWSEKYRPKVIEDLLITKENLNKVHIWIKGFIKKKDPNISNCLFLYGPPGCGKTSLAYIILNKYKYDIIELNASELRNKKNIKDQFEDILQKKNILSMFQQTKTENAIIMDEIDGLTIGERGTLSEIIKIMFPKKNEMKANPSKFRYKRFNPFICISNSLDKKINEIKRKSVFIEVKNPNQLQMEKIAKHILTKEKKKYDNQIIKDIVHKSQYDIRRMLTLLEYLFNYKEFIFSYKKIKSLLDEIDNKNKDETTYSLISEFSNNYNFDKITEQFFNKNLSSMIIYENFINLINNKHKSESESKKLNEIIDIYKHFSESDNIEYTIHMNQNWDLYTYYCLYTCIIPLFKISQLKQCSFKKNTSLNFSTLLNKTSLEYLNLKFINNVLLFFNYSNSIDIFDLAKLFKNNDYSNVFNIDPSELKKLCKFLE